ncbi:hypothetical protein LOZ58_000308 [Ophidiomyces ophidiicola]|nr:hypothetical protein LOZ58_000308 [Ophidiomyces ophidiicola]
MTPRQLLLLLVSTAFASGRPRMVAGEDENFLLPNNAPDRSGAKQAPGERTPAQLLTDKFSRLTLLSGGCVLFFFLIWATALRFSAHLRRLVNLSNDTQKYFISSDKKWSWLKKNILYAPLFRTRHNREFRLSSAINFGTLPTRFQAAMLTGTIMVNVILCFVTIPHRASEEILLGTIRHRTGTMAVVNLIPLVVMAGRNNPLIKFLDISFDTWNLLHRWLGRIVVVESAAHVIAWAINKVHTMGWDSVITSFRESEFIKTGLISTVAFTILLLHSPSPIRHAFYEVFLHFHITLVIIALAFLWVHLKNSQLQRHYLIAAISLWVVERAVRLTRLIYINLGKGGTNATVEILPGDAMRITLNMARPWAFKPGQHLYLYIPAVGFWMSHPFTAAWGDVVEAIPDEKDSVSSQRDAFTSRKPVISLVVRRRTGLTNDLYELVDKNSEKQLTLRALVEGPYGTEHTLDSYGTVVLFAAGVGITHQISYVQRLVEGFSNGTVAARRVTLVWIIQSLDHLEWVRPWMNHILKMDRRREVLRIMLFITRPRCTKELQCSSSTVQMFPGKPDIGVLLDREAKNQIGAMGVLVCGTGSLSDDVRRACRERQSPTHIDFVEECFTW